MINDETLVARNNMLESDNRLLADKLKKKEQEKKILEKRLEQREHDIRDLKEIINTDIARCGACTHLDIRNNMSYVGNELVCGECRAYGYGE